MLNLKKLSFRLVFAALLLSAATSFTIQSAVAEESAGAAATVKSDDNKSTDTVSGEDEGMADDESDAGEGSGDSTDSTMPED